MEGAVDVGYNTLLFHIVEVGVVAEEYFGALFHSAQHFRDLLLILFKTIQAENYKDNIRVTIVCPGRVQTNISVHALEKDGRQHGKMDAGQAGGVTPQQAADKIVRAVYKKRREVLVGKKELLMAYIKRFFPGLCARLARKVKAM